jgi:hypothetical protein
VEGFDFFGEGAVMSRFSKAVTVGLVTGILGLVASLIPVGLHLEESVGLDLLFRLRGAREVPRDVMIVSMDKVSADNLNLPPDPKKWPRSLHARLTENLARQLLPLTLFSMSRLPRTMTRYLLKRSVMQGTLFYVNVSERRPSP